MPLAKRLFALAALQFLALFGGIAAAGGPITSAQVVVGNLAGPSFSESWTFSGTNGQRVLIGAVKTSGGIDTVIRLKNPSNVEVVNTNADRVDYQLLATGTYTIVIDDSGLNDAGGYSLSFLNITAGPWTTGPDPDGGAITSAEVKTGQMQQFADFDAFVFTGTAGDRVVVAAAATGGASFDTNILIYPPNGNAALGNTFTGDRFDVQLTTTGTHVILIEDYGNDHAGTYSMSFLNVTSGPLTIPSDLDGGALASAEVKSAAFTTAPDFDAYRFTGAVGDRVLIGAVKTGAGAHDTVTYLYPPGGGAPVVATNGDRNEFKLVLAGQYTLVIEESGYNETGAYNVSLLNITSGPYTIGADPDGGAMTSAEVKTGQMQQFADFDAYVFTGTAGDRVVVAAAATGGASFDTNILIYPPNGNAALGNTFTGDRFDVQLTTTGTHVILIEDYGNDHAGTYSMSLLNVTSGPLTIPSDLDGGALASAEVKSAAFTTAPDFDAYRFTGAVGDRVLIGAVKTGAGAYDTVTYLYPPGGGAPVVATNGDRNEFKLVLAGQYTLVIEESGYNETGAYNVSLLNITSGPYTIGADPDGGAMTSAEVKSGQMQQIADFDAYVFTGTAGDRVVVAAAATGGASFDTNILIYPPNGAAALGNTFTGDRFDVQLTTTGTHVILIEDYGNDHAGTYSMSFLNVTSGPLTIPSDLDGGALASAEVKSAAFTTAPDFDAYRFTGAVGDRVLIGAVKTGAGAYDTVTYLYPPGGGAPVVATNGDRNEFKLVLAGQYTLVIEESGYNETGAYNVSLLNITSGPYTIGADPDGGAMTSAEVKSGQMQQIADFDAYVFTGTAGDRVVIATAATGGASFDTNILIYPPNGNAALGNTFTGDRFDVQLTTTGTHVILIEDYGNDHAGTYSMSFLNVTAGPLTIPSDLDGGVLPSATVRSATFTTAPDFDAYQFAGLVGDRVVIAAVKTGAGAYDTVTYLYPPGGGAPVVATNGDRNEFRLALPGIHTIVIEESGYNETGGYNVSLLNVTSGPFSNVADPDGGPMVSSQQFSGQTNLVGDLDGYTFAGTAGNRVLIAAVATSAAGYDTNIVLYPPNGLPGEANTFTGDKLEIVLAQTGTYTIVVEDYGNDHTGNYGMTLLNLTAGPLSNLVDHDGSENLVTTATWAGRISPVPDFDAFRFTGLAGESATINCVATGGAIDTQISIYKSTGAAVVSTTTDLVNYVLPSAGTYTIVIEDSGLTDSGTYALSFNKTGSTTDVEQEPDYDLTQVVVVSPYPNPFARTANLEFSLPREMAGSVRIFDAEGALVRTLASGALAAGRHSYAWDGRDARGIESASGIYFFDLQAGPKHERRKLVRMR